MKNIWKYILVGLGVFAAALVVAMPFFLRTRWIGWQAHGMRRLPFSMIGLPLMGLRFLIPLLFVALVVLVVVLLLRRPAAAVEPTVKATSSLTCPQCGKPVQYEWVACPLCGKNLRE